MNIKQIILHFKKNIVFTDNCSFFISGINPAQPRQSDGINYILSYPVTVTGYISALFVLTHQHHHNKGPPLLRSINAHSKQLILISLTQTISKGHLKWQH